MLNPLQNNKPGGKSRPGRGGGEEEKGVTPACDSLLAV